jgi:hypothetical protein
MKSSRRIPIAGRAATLCACLATAPVFCQQEAPNPATTVDLKPLGAAPDLFTDQSDSRYRQRGVLNLFWLGDDRIAVAFSTNRLWSGNDKPEPLHVRLLLFDPFGRELNERDWSFAADGPDGDTTLALAPGPDRSILAIHQAAGDGKIPEGDFVQVLNPDASLRQDFYVPATSAPVTGNPSYPGLILQTFYADKHTSLAWWSGHPLKPGAQLAIPSGSEATIAGPEVAARAVCPTDSLLSALLSPPQCSGVRVFRADAPPWTYTTPSPELAPLPRVFLNSDSLLIELRSANDSGDQTAVHKDWLVAHPDGSHTQLPALPKGLQILEITGVSVDARRFSMNAGAIVGVCGVINLWCKQRATALVVDIPANRILFQREISTTGGTSALSPDGRRIAIFDRDKLSVYPLP